MFSSNRGVSAAFTPGTESAPGQLLISGGSGSSSDQSASALSVQLSLVSELLNFVGNFSAAAAGTDSAAEAAQRVIPSPIPYSLRPRLQRLTPAEKPPNKTDFFRTFSSACLLVLPWNESDAGAEI